MPFRSSLADIESNASVFHSRTPPRPGCPPEQTPKHQDNRSRRRREQAGDQIPPRGQGVLALGQQAHQAIRRTGRFLSPRRVAAPRDSWHGSTSACSQVTPRGGWGRAGNSQRAPSAEASDLGASPCGRRPQPSRGVLPRQESFASLAHTEPDWRQREGCSRHSPRWRVGFV